MLKKLIKNKKGDTVIYGVVIIPFIALITFTIIFYRMEEAIKFKNLQTTLDNVCSFTVKTYGKIKIDSNNIPYCEFDTDALFNEELDKVIVSDTSESIMNYSLDLSSIDEYNPNNSTNPYKKNSFLYDLFNSLTKINGINKYWKFELEIRKNKIEETMMDPSQQPDNKYLKFKVTANLPKSNLDTIEDYELWYNNNQKTWKSIVASKNFANYNVEVYATCV